MQGHKAFTKIKNIRKQLLAIKLCNNYKQIYKFFSEEKKNKYFWPPNNYTIKISTPYKHT